MRCMKYDPIPYLCSYFALAGMGGIKHICCHKVTLYVMRSASLVSAVDSPFYSPCMGGMAGMGGRGGRESRALHVCPCSESPRQVVNIASVLCIESGRVLAARGSHACRAALLLGHGAGMHYMKLQPPL
eukprot:1159161-Pelagomonas_calceolata.AAC.6